MNIAKIMTPKYSTACLQEDSTVRQGLEIMRRYGYTAIRYWTRTADTGDASPREIFCAISSRWAPPS